MLRRMIAPLVFGFAGAAVLIGLGLWQVERLAWKEGVLSTMQARIAAPPVAVPVSPDPEVDNYRAVQATGRASGPEQRVFTSGTKAGIGYRIVTAFVTTDGRRILIDHGFLPEADKAAPAAPQAVRDSEIIGNLIWPDDKTGSTPPPDMDANMWFARDVDAMAKVLDTEPLMIVLRETSQPDTRLTLLPVDTSGIRNDHRDYAITWFSLAAVWLGMTALLVWRIRRHKA